MQMGMSERDRLGYLNQIRRLQERNRLLAECLADERRLRKRAYKYYMDRLRSRFLRFMDMVMLVARGQP